MARSPRRPYLSPATGGEANPYFATMQGSPEFAADLRELAGRRPSGAPRRSHSPPLPPLSDEERAIVKSVRKSIINTATRGDEDKQSIATPWAFIHALEQRFGTPVDWDLAADADNKKVLASGWFGPGSTFGEDSLTRDWSFSNLLPVRLAFLNPPFSHIKPWARKVADCRWLPRWTVMLVPASYSTDWFLELAGQVQRCAVPRLQFEGATHLYPKDLVLVIAGFGVVGDGYWDWRASYLQWCRAHAKEAEAQHFKGLSRFPVDPVLPDFPWTPDPFWKPHDR